MTLLLTLDPVSSSQESRIYVKSVFHKFVKLPTIPEFKSKLYACANMFDVINGLGELQDKRLKNYHPLGVPLPISYTVDLH